MEVPVPVAVEEAKLTKTEIADLKREIKSLFSNYKTRRLELGIKLLELQEALAMPRTGTFVSYVRDELGIPTSTCYDIMKDAEKEIELMQLSESRKDDDDITFTFDELYK